MCRVTCRKWRQIFHSVELSNSSDSQTRDYNSRRKAKFGLGGNREGWICDCSDGIPEEKLYFVQIFVNFLVRIGSIRESNLVENLTDWVVIFFSSLLPFPD